MFVKNVTLTNSFKRFRVMLYNYILIDQKPVNICIRRLRYTYSTVWTTFRKMTVIDSTLPILLSFLRSFYLVREQVAGYSISNYLIILRTFFTKIVFKRDYFIFKTPNDFRVLRVTWHKQFSNSLVGSTHVIFKYTFVLLVAQKFEKNNKYE